MKKGLSLFLAIIFVLGMFTGCQNTSGANTTTQAETTTNNEEQDTLRVLVIGNSHSDCALGMLYEVFQKEAPEQKVELGVLYYSACRMALHADFIQNESPEYSYRKTVAGRWQSIEASTVKKALDDEQWDIVSLQQMNYEIGNEASYVAEDYMTVINYVYDNQAVAPKLYFHAPWSNPDDESFWDFENSAEYFNTWVQTHNTYYPDATGKFNTRVMYEKEMELVQKYLVDTTEFLGKKYFDTVVPSATAVQYAIDVLKVPYQDLYRDHTHMTDFGRLLVSYFWYAKLMGLSSIDAVNVSKIPNHLHAPRSEFYPEITQQKKDVIIKSVNWALEHPYEVPTQ